MDKAIRWFADIWWARWRLGIYRQMIEDQKGTIVALESSVESLRESVELLKTLIVKLKVDHPAYQPPANEVSPQSSSSKYN